MSCMAVAVGIMPMEASGSGTSSRRPFMAPPLGTVPVILGLTDLAERWRRSREFVRLRMKNDDAFPKAAGAINGGRNRFWLVSDLEAYEARNEELKPRRSTVEQFRSTDARGKDGVSIEGTEPPPSRSAPDPTQTGEPMPLEHKDDTMEAALSSLRAQRAASPRPKRELTAGQQAALQRIAERDAEQRGLRVPTGYEVAYRFEKKPPFEMRKKMKEDGWRYVPAQRHWTKIADLRELDVFHAIFVGEGAVQTFKKPVFENAAGPGS